LMANSTRGIRSGQLSCRSLTKARSTSSMTPLTRSTLLVVLWWCGDPKIRVEPSARWRDVHRSAVNRTSRSETMVSGSPTDRKTDAIKFRAAVSAVAVLNVGTSHTRPVSRSMCTCRKSWPERARGSSMKSNEMVPPRRDGTGNG